VKELSIEKKGGFFVQKFRFMPAVLEKFNYFERRSQNCAKITPQLM